MRPMIRLVPAVLLVVGVAWAGQPSKRPTDEERGRELYERHCVQCHGATVAGDGPVAAALVKKVPDLSGETALSADNREANVTVVLDGRGLMPSYVASFDRYDARRVMRYMERVARDPAAATAEPEAPEPETDEPDGPEGN